MVERRFGIGEWYGRSFVDLDLDERRALARLQLASGEQQVPPCPFLTAGGVQVRCWKPGGVCSLRQYERDDRGEAKIVPDGGRIRTTCPSRFEENGLIYRWIAGTVFGQDAVPVGQVNFLRRVALAGAGSDPVDQREGVGRIDNVLIIPGSDPLRWVAVEIQAVYFSGDAMRGDFNHIAGYRRRGIPFPAGRRRPDYRSSGPKRLMPQLMIKVPTLRRWGKRMAVVVDQDFFGAMGKMNTVNELSNCDVAWFVVGYSDDLHLAQGSVHLTTLEDSVQGLVAGEPVSLPEFEERIKAKADRLGPGP